MFNRVVLVVGCILLSAHCIAADAVAVAIPNPKDLEKAQMYLRRAAHALLNEHKPMDAKENEAKAEALVPHILEAKGWSEQGWTQLRNSKLDDAFVSFKKANAIVPCFSKFDTAQKVRDEYNNLMRAEYGLK